MRYFALDDNTAKYFSDMYDDTFSGKKPGNIFVIGAAGDAPAGVMVASIFLDEVTVNWIYVKEEFRNKGVAKGLFTYLVDKCRSINITDITAFTSADDEYLNKGLKSLGFALNYNLGWNSYESTLGRMKKINVPENGGFALSPFMLAGMKTIEQFNDDIYGEDVLIGVPHPINPIDYSPFSCCSIKDGKITALTLVTCKEIDGKTEIEFPWIYSDKKSIHALAACYNASLSALNDEYPADSRVMCSCINSTIDDMIRRIMPEARITENYIAVLEL